MKMNSIINSWHTNGEEAIINKENETGDKHKFGAEPIKNQMPSKLLKFTVMPKHLQFNPFVYTGYRPQMNSWECIMSLTYLHNETLNILTHGLPLLYALWSLPKLLPWNEMPLPILPYFHAAATVCPWLGSSIYHLFMNHHSGVKTYERLLQWDVAGVWVTQSCGGFSSIFVGTMCLPWPIRYLLLLIYISFAIKALHAAVYATGPWQRRISFAAMFIMRLLILCLRYTPYGGGHPELRTVNCLNQIVVLQHRK
ncbi:progestin and adipoQ receptor family member 4-like isoform X3 [Argiope bruennichi]|uniref:progestin and adipoQ receptor family member 4-like isoform X3 n=1 Tax=Argiope bruennichi TaxID=94029 RepID=UPI002493DFA8|nr:progestin and adipoQ receptor family member 4-like isoform X3 [Argiope bruennichi]